MTSAVLSSTYITSFNATYLSKTSITLTWSGSYDSITLYMTEDKKTYTLLAENYTGTSFTIENLTVGKRYYFSAIPNKKTNLMYSKSEGGLNPNICINGAILNNVYGIASNSGYGFAPPANAIYLDNGEKLSFVTPKSYPSGMRTGDVEIEVDLNTYTPTF